LKYSEVGRLAADSVIVELRAATADHHRRIENLLALEALDSSARYGQVLQGFDAFLSRWEDAVCDSLPADLQRWFVVRRRGEHVRRDLRMLGVPRLPAARFHLDLSSIDRVFGSLYVLEGSALGAQVIAPVLERRLGLNATNGARYFAGFGDRTGGMWREFRTMLASHVQDRHACAAAAVATFDALASTFTESLHGTATA